MTKERAALPWKVIAGQRTLFIGDEKCRPLSSCSQAAALVGSATLRFVIPSEAEGSAVQRARLGNVFRQTLAPGFSSFWVRPSVPGVLNPVATSAPGDTPAQLPVRRARSPPLCRVGPMRCTPARGESTRRLCRVGSTPPPRCTRGLLQGSSLVQTTDPPGDDADLHHGPGRYS